VAGVTAAARIVNGPEDQAAREQGEVGGRVGALVPVLRYVARQLIRDELARMPGSGLPRVRLLHSISQASVLVAETRLSHLAPVC
jgi:hypothetical protein